MEIPRRMEIPKEDVAREFGSKSREANDVRPKIGKRKQKTAWIPFDCRSAVPCRSEV